MRAGKKISLAVGISVAVAAAFVSPASATTAPTVYLETGGNGNLPVGYSSTQVLTNGGTDAHDGAFSLTSSSNVLQVSGASSSYMPSYVNGVNSSGTGDASGTGDSIDFLQVSGFGPSSDKEIYALKLDYNGKYLDPTTIAGSEQLNYIISDINVANSSTYGGVIASTVPSSLMGDFPGYDLIISIPSSYLSTVSTGTPAEFDFGFDFSNFNDSNVSEPVTVTDIGVIPEPASAALLGILAVPALLSRRRSAV